MAHRGKGRGRSDPGSPPEYLKSEDAEARDSPAGDKRTRLDCPHPYQSIPQYIEVPPNVEAEQVISCISTAPSSQPNQLLSRH